MQTIVIKDRNGQNMCLTSFDVVVCPICNRNINIAVVALHTGTVYAGEGMHWSSCGCRWYIELGEVSNIHWSELDDSTPKNEV